VGKFLLLFVVIFVATGCLNRTTSSKTCNKTNKGIEICDGVDNDCDGVIDAGECKENNHCSEGENTLLCVADKKMVSCKDKNYDKNKVVVLIDVEVKWTDDKWSDAKICETKCNENRIGDNCENCKEGFQDNDNDGTCKEVCLVADCSKSGMTGECSVNDNHEATCICSTGYTGENCETCENGFAKDSAGACKGVCELAECDKAGMNGECSVNSEYKAVCECREGNTGENCESGKENHQDNDGDGVFEKNCEISDLACDSNNMTSLCDDESGTAVCECKDGYSGENCTVCADGYQDNDNNGVCEKNCEKSEIVCTLDNMTGACSDESGVATCVCNAAYSGGACNTCAENYQDNNTDGVCEADCSISCNESNQLCDDTSGTSVCSCASAYQDNDNNGTCTEDCSIACKDDHMNSCDVTSGTAVCGCEENYILNHNGVCEFQGAWELDKEIKESVLATDSLGNIYLAGFFDGSFDFNFIGGDSDIQTSSDTGSIFLTKINADSTYAWTKIIAESDKMGKVNEMTVDKDNNIYIVGHFLGNINFGLLNGVDEKYLAAENTDGSEVDNTDIFVTKIKADSSYDWTRVIGGNYQDSALSVAAGDDYLYVTGYFQDKVDFDFGDGVDERVSEDFTRDMFLIKMGLSGNYLPSKVSNHHFYYGGTGVNIYINKNNLYCINTNYSSRDNDYYDDYYIVDYDLNRYDYLNYNTHNITRKSIAFDSRDSMYVTGGFGFYSNAVDFDFGDEVDRFFSSDNSSALFLMKINANKTYNNTKALNVKVGSGGYVSGNKLLIDKYNNIYIIGEFRGIVDFNFADDKVDEKTSNERDRFITKIDKDYNYKWTETFDDLVITSSVFGQNGSLYFIGHNEAGKFFIKKRNMVIE